MRVLQKTNILLTMKMINYCYILHRGEESSFPTASDRHLQDLSGEKIDLDRWEGLLLILPL